MSVLARVWAMQQTGAPEVLQPASRLLPAPAPGQVLIRVVASGFNPIDAKIRAGIAAIAPEQGVLGCDVSGYVEQVGAGVTALTCGDAVFGCAGGVRGHAGSLASHMLTDARLLAKAPGSVSLAQAAALPVPALTALHLQRRLQLMAGDELAILGGSGAVGQLLTQLALLAGCRVTGTGGSEQRLQQIRALGARAVLHRDITEAGIAFNKVADTFGGEALQRALQIAATAAQVATINARGQHELALAHAKALTLHAVFVLLPLLNGVQPEQHQQDLIHMAALIDAQQIHPQPADEVPMSEVAEVHRRYDAGALAQKVVLLAD